MEEEQKEQVKAFNPNYVHTNWKVYKLVFINDDTLEGNIKMYDVLAIKNQRKKQQQKNLIKQKMRF